MVHDYLAYLGLQREPPSFKYLQKLITRHIKKVAVENLDFYYERKPLLDINRIFKKVLQGRGGIAIHLNALFLELLRELGFTSEIRSIQFYKSSLEQYSRRLKAMGIVITLDEAEYFVDIADIKGITSPLEIVKNKVQLNETKYYQWHLEPFDDHLYLRKSADALTFHPYLQIEPKEVKLIEYLSAHDNFQSVDHEVSKRRWLFRRKEQGYVYLKDDQLEVLELGKKTVSTIENEEAFWSLSVQHFGISRESVFNQEAGT